MVEEEGILRLSSMGSGMWYKVLLESNVTKEVDENGFTFTVTTKPEKMNPDLPWSTIWSRSFLPGLDSEVTSFLFKMLNDLLTTQVRFHRVLTTVTSSNCTLCDREVQGDLLHTLIYCSYNLGSGDWLLRCLTTLLPQLQPKQPLTLNFNTDLQADHNMAVTWFTANVLHEILGARVKKKRPEVYLIRATLEAKIMLLRKSRYSGICDIISNMLATT